MLRLQVVIHIFNYFGPPYFFYWLERVVLRLENGFVVQWLSRGLQSRFANWAEFTHRQIFWTTWLHEGGFTGLLWSLSLVGMLRETATFVRCFSVLVNLHHLFVAGIWLLTWRWCENIKSYLRRCDLFQLRSWVDADSWLQWNMCVVGNGSSKFQSRSLPQQFV